MNNISAAADTCRMLRTCCRMEIQGICLCFTVTLAFVLFSSFLLFPPASKWLSLVRGTLCSLQLGSIPVDRISIFRFEA